MDGWTDEQMERGKEGWMEGIIDGSCPTSKFRRLVLHK